MTGAIIAASNGIELITANSGFVLLVGAIDTTHLQIMIADNFREIVPPNEQVFTILPRCFVPKRFISAGSPY